MSTTLDVPLIQPGFLKSGKYRKRVALLHTKPQNPAITVYNPINRKHFVCCSFVTSVGCSPDDRWDNDEFLGYLSEQNTSNTWEKHNGRFKSSTAKESQKRQPLSTRLDFNDEIKLDEKSLNGSRPKENHRIRRPMKVVKVEEISTLQPLSRRPDFSPDLKMAQLIATDNCLEGSNCAVSDNSLAALASMELQLQEMLKDSQTKAAYHLVKELMVKGMIPGSEPLCRLLGQLCKTGGFESAQNLLQEVKQKGGHGFAMDERTYGLMIKTALQENNVYEAADLLETMVWEGFHPRVATWSSVVARLARSKLTAPQALRLFDRICAKSTLFKVDHMRADTGAFNAAMNAAVTAGWLPFAEALLHNGMPAMQVSPNHISFNILIKGYAMSGEVHNMRSLVNEMKECGIRPDVTTYNTLVAAYIGVGDLGSALSIVDEMHDLGGEYSPQVRTLTTLMKGYLEQGLFDDAGKILRDMKVKYNCNPNEVSFTTMLSAFIKSGDMNAAKCTLTHMRELKVPASVVTYNSLLNGFCQTQQMEAAMDLFDHMSLLGIPPNQVTFNTIINGFFQKDDCAAALSWFQKMKDRGLRPTEFTYTLLLNSLGQTGQTDLAAKVFDEMDRDPRVRIDLPAWNTMIHCFARVGRMRDAAGVFKKMKAAGLLPSLSTYGTLMKGFAKCGQAAEALVLWREIKERQLALSGGEKPQGAEDSDRDDSEAVRKWNHDSAEQEVLVLDEALLDDLVYACVKAGYFQKALEFVKEMEQAGCSPDRLKYKRLFIQLYSDLRSTDGPEWSTRGQNVEAMVEDRKKQQISPKRRHEGLEAFKFWLGLPNNYYQQEWTWRK